MNIYLYKEALMKWRLLYSWIIFEKGYYIVELMLMRNWIEVRNNQIRSIAKNLTTTGKSEREETYSDDIGITGGKKVFAGEELANLVNDHS